MLRTTSSRPQPTKSSLGRHAWLLKSWNAASFVSSERFVMLLGHTDPQITSRYIRHESATGAFHQTSVPDLELPLSVELERHKLDPGGVFCWAEKSGQNPRTYNPGEKAAETRSRLLPFPSIFSDS